MMIFRCKIWTPRFCHPLNSRHYFCATVHFFWRCTREFMLSLLFSRFFPLHPHSRGEYLSRLKRWTRHRDKHKRQKSRRCHGRLCNYRDFVAQWKSEIITACRVIHKILRFRTMMNDFHLLTARRYRYELRRGEKTFSSKFWTWSAWGVQHVTIPHPPQQI